MRTKVIKRILSVLGFAVFFALLALFLFSGDNREVLRSLFSEDYTREELRARLADFGIRGYITIVILAMLQVVFTFLPAEPVQVLAGVTFGFPVGLACCTVGVVLGNTVIYVLYRLYGQRMKRYFDRKLDFDLSEVGSSGKMALAIFILYFLPAIPYGMICIFAATMKMKYHRYILVTTLGAIPSVCIGVGLGHVAIASSWILSLGVFLVLVALLLIGMKKRETLFAKFNAWAAKKKQPYSSKTVVRESKKAALGIAYYISRAVLFLKGVKVVCRNKVGTIQAPSVVLANHGSFIDFVYAGSMIWKQKPNFPVARLYFYQKQFGNLLRFMGCFPKSMFVLDAESVKNSISVLKKGGVLAMMPEARLSTVGEFEDIQEGTFSFLKKTGAPIYCVKISGDYLAKPKWGNKLRRGAVVEAELDILLTAEELKDLSVEEIKQRVETALDYHELEWLSTRPQIHYHNRRMAEGLENILTICPKCGQKYTLYTRKKDVYCQQCGHLATIDDRYAFVGGEPFANFVDWFHWQEEQILAEIEGDAHYALTDSVVLKHSSLDGKKMLRTAGEGVCTLTREGLTYRGTEDGETIEKHFSMDKLYRLLFGAGENFEIYQDKEIYYFVPSDPRSAVDWYIASRILRDKSIR